MAMDAKQEGDNSSSGKELEADLQGKEKGILRLSTKQVKTDFFILFFYM